MQYSDVLKPAFAALASFENGSFSIERNPLMRLEAEVDQALKKVLVFPIIKPIDLSTTENKLKFSGFGSRLDSIVDNFDQNIWSAGLYNLCRANPAAEGFILAAALESDHLNNAALKYLFGMSGYKPEFFENIFHSIGAEKFDEAVSFVGDYLEDRKDNEYMCRSDGVRAFAKVAAQRGCSLELIVGPATTVSLNAHEQWGRIEMFKRIAEGYGEGVVHKKSLCNKLETYLSALFSKAALAPRVVESLVKLGEKIGGYDDSAGFFREWIKIRSLPESVCAAIILQFPESKIRKQDIETFTSCLAHTRYDIVQGAAAFRLMTLQNALAVERSAAILNKKYDQGSMVRGASFLALALLETTLVSDAPSQSITGALINTMKEEPYIFDWEEAKNVFQNAAVSNMNRYPTARSVGQILLKKVPLEELLAERFISNSKAEIYWTNLKALMDQLWLTARLEFGLEVKRILASTESDRKGSEKLQIAYETLSREKKMYN